MRDAERRGELLSAVDLAEQGLAEHPGDIPLQHRAVLALARAGATDEAARRFAAFGLDAIPDEEVASLGARIAKDQALALVAPERCTAASTAAGRYRAVYELTHGYYPAINAATLSLLAGEPEKARSLAGETLALTAGESSDDYYVAATRAEAHLLLGDLPATSAALEQAVAVYGGDHGALATTRRQLRLVCDALGVDRAILDVLAGPGVVHFCGHLVSAPGRDGRFPAEREGPVAALIAAAVAGLSIGYAYGALAAGADIMWAEALLVAGAELHVVLPCERREFIDASVAVAGERWVARFESCMARATDVTYATADAFLGDDSLFRYGTELAMGLALARARYLDAEVTQLAVWDGQGARGEAGTAIDVAAWRHAGRRTVIVPVHDAALGNESRRPAAGAPGRPSRSHSQSPSLSSSASPSLNPSASPSPAIGGRVVRALLFGDVKGFSKLTDEQLPHFAEHVLAAFADVIGRHGAAVEHANTWGDAVYIVVSDVQSAAQCALELQEAMAAIDLDAARLPAHLALRLGAHIGPVFPIHDPVIDRMGFMGSHVSRTARVEPVTPPGEVYVTEAFAAAVALSETPAVRCDYVGHLPGAKDWGRMRMYRLRRVAVSALAQRALP